MPFCHTHCILSFEWTNIFPTKCKTLIGNSVVETSLQTQPPHYMLDSDESRGHCNGKLNVHANDIEKSTHTFSINHAAYDFLGRMKKSHRTSGGQTVTTILMNQNFQENYYLEPSTVLLWAFFRFRIDHRIHFMRAHFFSPWTWLTPSTEQI